jgi:hypothetical protein
VVCVFHASHHVVTTSKSKRPAIPS